MLLGQRRAGGTGDPELSGQIVKGTCGGRTLGSVLLVRECDWPVGYKAMDLLAHMQRQE